MISYITNPFILIAIWLVRNAMNICLAVVIVCNQFYNYIFNDIWNQCVFLLSRCVFVYSEDSTCEMTISITARIAIKRLTLNVSQGRVIFNTISV